MANKPTRHKNKAYGRHNNNSRKKSTRFISDSDGDDDDDLSYSSNRRNTRRLRSYPTRTRPRAETEADDPSCSVNTTPSNHNQADFVRMASGLSGNNGADTTASVSLTSLVRKVYQYDYLRRLSLYWAIHPNNDLWIPLLATVEELMVGNWQLLILRCRFNSSDQTYREYYTRTEVFETIITYAIALRELDEYTQTSEAEVPYEAARHVLFSLIGAIYNANQNVNFGAFPLRPDATTREGNDWRRHEQALSNPAVGKIIVDEQGFDGIRSLLAREDLVVEDEDGKLYYVDMADLQTSFREYRQPPCGTEDGEPVWELDYIVSHRFRDPPRRLGVDYLMKFVGWPLSEWYPQEDIAAGARVLIEYHNKHPEIPRPRRMIAEQQNKVQADVDQRPDQLDLLEEILWLQAWVEMIERDLQELNGSMPQYSVHARSIMQRLNQVQEIVDEIHEDVETSGE